MSDINNKIKILHLKKLTGHEKDVCGLWDVVIQFDIAYTDTYPIGGDDSPENSETILGKWLSYNFSEGFVFVGIGSRRIAGGAVDNKKAWDGGWFKDDDFLSEYYQVRCSFKDATLFYLKFT